VRHPGYDLRAIPAGFECAQKRGESGKVRERITEYTDSQGLAPQRGDVLHEVIDGVDATANHDCGVRDGVPNDGDAGIFERADEVGGCEQGDASATLA
jgi:hypothetical protein